MKNNLMTILKKDIAETLSSSVLDALDRDGSSQNIWQIFYEKFEQKLLYNRVYQDLGSDDLNYDIIPYLCSKKFRKSAITLEYKGYKLSSIPLSSLEGKSLDYIRGTIVSLLINNSEGDVFEVKRAKNLGLLGYSLKKGKVLVVYGKTGPGLGYKSCGGNIIRMKPEVLDFSANDILLGSSAGVAASYWSAYQNLPVAGALAMSAIAFILFSAGSSDLRHYILERKISSLLRKAK